MDYAVHILIVIAIYAILAIGLNLVAGHVGIFPLAQAGFFGVGAYTSAVLVGRFHIAPLLALAAGVLLSATASLAVSLPALRIRDDYFVLATLGLQVLWSTLFNNLTGITGGSLGIANIPTIGIFGWHPSDTKSFAVVALILLGVVIVIVSRIVNSPFGRVLHAIREDDKFPESLGKNILKFKVVAFAVSAALAAVAGSIYAHYMTFIDPSSFGVMDSILIISMVVIGGAGNIWGIIGGTALLIILPEALRFMGVESSRAANVREIFYGGALVVVLLLRPRGMSRKLAESK